MSGLYRKEWSLDLLGEALLEAAAHGDFERALADAQSMIEQEELGSEELFRYRVMFFDLARVSTTRAEVQIACSADLLAVALEVGESGWQTIRRSNRRAEIEQLALATEGGTELLELLAYAPDDGLRQIAVNGLISAGMRALAAGSDSRRFERLLHGVGATAEAYGLETIRKSHAKEAVPRFARRNVKDSRLPVQVIAIAGGHSRMRNTAASLLERYGVTVVSIPSSREAVRREHDILQVLQGTDAVVLAVRQITHSTSDQVRKAAERLGIPVIFSKAVSALALERELIELEYLPRSA